MIGFLIGKLHAKQPPLLLVNVNGVGYEVEAPMSTFYALGSEGSDVTLLTHMHVREDAMLLFGFATEHERALFKELIKVNGVGAKMALAILSSMSVQEFVFAVDAANAAGLTKIPGVGKKTADRLVIEMRDRLKNWALMFASKDKPVHLSSQGASVAASAAIGHVQRSAINALESLGYKTAQAETMIGDIDAEGLTLEALIKKALQAVKV